MSKSVQAAVEVVESTPSLGLAWKNWHPFYMSPSGTPCYIEFMKLSECLNHKNGKCEREYRQLLRCLREYGLDF